jgi:hypothetical protein
MPSGSGEYSVAKAMAFGEVIGACNQLPGLDLRPSLHRSFSESS